jgi:hypothetical protein
LKKRKIWDGFQFGDPNIASAHTKAWIEAYGSEKSRKVQAQGEVGFSLSAQPIEALEGLGMLESDDGKVHALLQLKFMGQALLALPLEGDDSLEYQNEKALQHGFDKKIEKTFFVGPVPLMTTLGIHGEVSLGWKVAATSAS